MDLSTIMIGFFAGAFGLAYLVYGKKTANFSYLISGLLLICYPYFINNVFISIGVGVIFLGAPFLLKRFL
ncbi:MAG: hypothetical protein ACM3MK_05445 [Chitinophagales bacterium]